MELRVAATKKKTARKTAGRKVAKPVAKGAKPATKVAAAAAAVDLAVVEFADGAAWRTWLKRNHASSPGIWIKFAKKGSGLPSITRAEAVDGALCWGWIDGQGKSHDATYWLNKFTPRRSRSIWSKINRARALALIASGDLAAPGLAEVERAKADGRWDAAYDSPRTSAIPEDFAKALTAKPRAAAFFKTLNAANRYAILWRLQTAKRPETRAKRIEQFVAMLVRGEKIHP
jgi:uncharacterized protein YdeI (YjbR/CyaY-like superfamily)